MLWSFFFNDTATTEIYTLSLHDALPIFDNVTILKDASAAAIYGSRAAGGVIVITTKSGAAGKMKLNRSEEHTSELQSRQYLVCRLLLEKKLKQCNRL